MPWLTNGAAFIAALSVALIAIVLPLNSSIDTIGHFICPDKPATLAKARHVGLGSAAPWLKRNPGEANISIDVPARCRVDQIQMIVRRATSIPDEDQLKSSSELVRRLLRVSEALTGPLQGFDGWSLDPIIFLPEAGHLMSTGPHAGTLYAFDLGVKLRTRYTHLRAQAINNQTPSIWSDEQEATKDTAKHIAAGFFDLDWSAGDNLRPIDDRNIITTAQRCATRHVDVAEPGTTYGSRMLEQYKASFLPTIAARLAPHAPGINLTAEDVWTMHELCALGVASWGSHSICHIFTHEEWLQFEYAHDVYTFYDTGPGSRLGPSIGLSLLNAVTAGLRDPIADPVSFYSVDGSDMIAFVAALDLLPQYEPLSLLNVVADRAWRTAEVIPMGGRIIIERLACQTTEQACWVETPMYPNHVYCEPLIEEWYVRINVNDAIVPISGCESGPGHSCRIDHFANWVATRNRHFGDPGLVCEL